VKYARLIFITCFLFQFSVLKSQINFDSLWSVWNDTTQSDKNRLKAIKTIAWDGYLFTQPDSAFYFAQLQYDFAQSVNHKLGMGMALNIQGVSFFFNGNYDKALEYHNKSLKVKEEIGYKKGIAASYNNIGSVYKKLGNYEKAMEFHKKSLKISEELGNKSGVANCYYKIGIIYSFQGNYEKVFDYNNKCLEIFKEIDDKQGIAYCYNNLGENFNEQGDYEKALEFYNKSFEIIKEMGDTRAMGVSFNNIGGIYEIQDNYVKALEYYSKSLEIKNEIGDKEGISSTYSRIGLVYEKQGEYEKALGYLLQSKKIKQELNIISELDETVKYLTQVYEKLNNPKKALENYKFYVSIKDSLAAMDGKEKEKQHQFHEQYLLEKQADSIKHADEIIIHQAETKTEKQRRNGLILISLIVLVSLGIVIKQLNKVRNGKVLVEKKQKEITDSINYAKRLQQGILVPFDLVQSWLSDSFIFYEPKDIVSGDFYWIEKVGNKVYFAVADCTGHGIPGALVSIICSSALTKSLYEDSIYEPSKILDNTRIIVENRFARSQDKINDGMDISLCCLNVDDKSLTWAGAINPLWVVRKGSDEIEETKPDWQFIGMVEKPKKYKQHEIKLAKGDSIYLFSDGFQDQFGGEKGRKYLKGRFKKFILSVKDKDMQSQKALFKNEFKSWKGTLEQVDDVCIMGVRIT
tara:strand:- start:491 stop:2560 length:2070 start_codon:yes stop_codon:yes gene_type:complete